MKKIVILALAVALCACTTTTITSTGPDGKPIVTKTTSQDPAVAAAIAKALADAALQAGAAYIKDQQGFAK